MQENTRKFIEEFKKKKQDKIDNGPIEMSADDLWRYSGEVEKFKEGFYTGNPYHYRHKTVKNVVIYNTLSNKDNLIIDAYFRDPNITLTDLAENLGKSPCFVRKVLDKYFEMKRNVNNE